MTEPMLADLARLHGVATAVDLPGGAREVSPDVLRAVLASLGVDAADGRQVEVSLASHRDRWSPLPPLVTTTAGRGKYVEATHPVGRLSQALVESPDGAVRSLRVDPPSPQRRQGGDTVRTIGITLPPDLPVGRHLLTVDFGDGGAVCPLLVGPTSLSPPPGLIGRQGWGLVGAVDAVGSELTRGGLPDLGDLAELVSFLGWDLRGDVIVLPESAPLPAPFLDPTRIRVRDIPEAAWVEGSARARLAGSHEDGLRAVYAVPRTPRRERAFGSFCEAFGQELLDVATWSMLSARHGDDPSTWPPGLRRSDDRAVEEARELAAGEVQFHRWCQWVADEQLATIGRDAAGAGMGLGLLQTVCLDAGPGAVGRWVGADQVAPGMRLGRPPQTEGDTGEVSRRSPWHPGVARDLGHAPLSRLLARSLRHRQGILLPDLSSALRQWWVPEGAAASEGTWVTHDHEALLAVVGIAAEAVGASVVGGTAGLDVWAQQWILGLGVLPWVELVGSAGLRHPDEVPISALTTLGVPSDDLPEELRRRLVQRSLVSSGASVADQARAAQRFLGWMPSLLRAVDVADLATTRPPLGQAPTLESLVGSGWARRLARQLSQR